MIKPIKKVPPPSFKKIKQHKFLQQLSAIISDKDASKEDVMDAGEKVFLTMYGGKVDDTLNNLR